MRSIQISVPTQVPSLGDMDLDIQINRPFSQLQSLPMQVRPDGLLLYVSQATYEPGTSPLSTWIPIRAYTEEKWKDDKAMKTEGESPAGGPLDKFEGFVTLLALCYMYSKTLARLLKRRINAQVGRQDASMDMDR